MSLNLFRQQPPTYQNVIPTGEGWYHWAWAWRDGFKWRRVDNWRRNCRWLSSGILLRLACEAVASSKVGEYRNAPKVKR